MAEEMEEVTVVATVKVVAMGAAMEEGMAAVMEQMHPLEEVQTACLRRASPCYCHPPHGEHMDSRRRLRSESCQ